MACNLDDIDKNDFIYEMPATRWIDGVPLGNGVIGAMLWGDGSPLRINLDKYDIWEMRENRPNPSLHNYPHVKAMVEQGKHVELQNELSLPPGKPHERGVYCTRLPLPRMEIQGVPMNSGRLSLKTATWQGEGWSAFVHAERPLMIIRNIEPRNIRVFYPDMEDPSISEDIRRMGDRWGWAKDCIKAWGYPPLECGIGDNIEYAVQPIPGNGEWVIAWLFRNDSLYITVSTHHDSHDPLIEATKTLNSAPDPETLHVEHCAWWDAYWSRSRVTLPDKRVENLFYAEMYKLGSSMRPDGYAVSLCGLWMQEASMPYCWGDYHLDLNLQQAYWPIYNANRLELGFSLYDHFKRIMPAFENMCRDFYGIDGLWCPCSIGFDGQFINADHRSDPGWTPLACTPSMLPWLTHNFWLHYRYSMDKDFLRDYALPFLEGVWKVYDHVLEEGADGRLHLPICHSPEYGECTPDVWQKDSSFDRAAIEFVCESLIEAEDALGINNYRNRAVNMLAKLYDYPGKNTFDVARGLTYSESHRHPAHLACIHPFGVYTVDDSAKAREKINRSLREIIRKGQGMWVGHSFSQMTLIYARTLHGNAAWRMVQEYFTLLGANSFTHSVDMRKFGATSLQGAGVTAVDSGFGMAAGILEMLLQSWGGIIRVFPATPDFWADASFDRLLAEGNVEVSAAKEDGAVRWVELKSKIGGKIYIRNPFEGSAIIDGGTIEGDILEIDVDPNETIRLESANSGVKTRKEKPEPLVPGRNWFGVKRNPRF